MTNALAEMFPNDPPRFLARTPHGYHDTALIRRELEGAGFSRVTIETRAEQSRAASPRIPAVAYCQGTPLRTEIEARDAGKLEAATDYAAAEIARQHGRAKSPPRFRPMSSRLQSEPENLAANISPPSSNRSDEAVIGMAVKTLP